MPTVAERTDDSELVMVVDADKSSGFACPDCGADVSHVVGHERAGDWYQQHFRYRTCGCYGKSPEDSAGGGGGSGESTLHKRRKLEALNYATNKYESASHDTEVWIGEKRADAVLGFETPHEDYGLGFAIEYQHKNEDKDIERTETVYARHSYTTLWLWESEFDIDPRGRPEVRLFDGRVCRPFPKGLPEYAHEFAESIGLGHLSQIRDGDRYPTDTSVPATLPLDWVAENTDPSVEQWRSRIGDIPETVFRDETWENLFDPGIDTGAPVEFPLTTSPPGTDSLDQISTDTSVPATLPLDWVAEVTDPSVEQWRSRIGDIPEAVFRNEPWANLFKPSDRTSPPVTRPHPGFSATLPLDWAVENMDPTADEWLRFFDSVDPRVWENTELSDIVESRRLDSAERGDKTRIGVTIPSSIPEYPPDGPTPLGCKSCPWLGDHGDYALEDRGKTGSTAVCPNCGGQLHLAHF
jgi:predicted RNA-binding Zn-ribbon protein involved in translation (DUF1610 family)